MRVFKAGAGGSLKNMNHYSQALPSIIEISTSVRWPFERGNFRVHGSSTGKGIRGIDSATTWGEYTNEASPFNLRSSKFIQSSELTF